MLRVDVFTIFPELIDHYASSSILGRAQDQGLLDVTACDLRDGATDARRTVDDTPFGGGAGSTPVSNDVGRQAVHHDR